MYVPVLTCLLRSADNLDSKSDVTLGLGVRSGFSLILSIIKDITAIMASTDPLTKHTRSVVPEFKIIK